MICNFLTNRIEESKVKEQVQNTINSARKRLSDSGSFCSEESAKEEINKAINQLNSKKGLVQVLTSSLLTLILHFKHV